MIKKQSFSLFYHLKDPPLARGLSTIKTVAVLILKVMTKLKMVMIMVIMLILVLQESSIQVGCGQKVFSLVIQKKRQKNTVFDTRKSR